MGNLQKKWQRKSNHDRQNGVEDPQAPGKIPCPFAPDGNTDIAEHIDDGGKAHGNGPQKHGLHGMGDHEHEDLRVERIPKDGDDGSDGEENDVEHEEHDGDILQPLSIIWEGIEQDRDDACPHRDGEPPDTR